MTSRIAAAGRSQPGPRVRGPLARRLYSLAVAMAVVTAAPALAQRGDKPREAAGPDPYTKDAPEALEALGYVQMGRFPLAGGHDTVQVEEDLGRVPICWIETEHFRLGCNLPAASMPRDKKERRRLGDELKALAKTLPRLRPRSVKKLDPWLRAHMFAQRLEAHYDKVEELLGVSAESFPGSDAPFFFRGDAPQGEPWMGRGPYFGVKGKFVVLLCEKQATAGRYLQTYTEAAPDGPSRWYFDDGDCFAYVVSAEFAEGAYASDRAMTAVVLFNITASILDAYRGYSFQPQCWWTEGIAHRLRREFADDVNCYSGYDGDGMRAYEIKDWGQRVRQRLKHGLVKPLDDIMDVTDPGTFKLVDHWACWTRIEFAYERFGDEAVAQFVADAKDGTDSRGVPVAADKLAKMHRAAFESAFGVDVATFETQWAEWVRREYR